MESASNLNHFISDLGPLWSQLRIFYEMYIVGTLKKPKRTSVLVVTFRKWSLLKHPILERTRTPHMGDRHVN